MTPTRAQQDPLGGIDRIVFPVDVVTVGDALAAALDSSGYRLAAAPEGDANREILMQLPIPDAHRSLGPMPLRLALQTPPVPPGACWRTPYTAWWRLISARPFEEVR